MKKITLLGSTGSIGQTAIQVARNLGKDKVKIVAIAANSNIDLLEEQAKEFSPSVVGVYDEKQGQELKKRLPNQKILLGAEGISEVAAFDEADLVLSAVVGTRGLVPTISAMTAGKTIALANKETLVSGGDIVMQLAKEKGVQLIPVDSEHSAIFQCLQGNKKNQLKRLIITASGGPFRKLTLDEMQHIKVEDALCHPNWSMGEKITVDSSTLMNKGLEVIEAHFLFGVSTENIDVVIHPQSVIHSMVEFVDGSTLAQLSEPTMSVPIQYAMTFPDRYPGKLTPLNFTKYSRLEFEQPDVLRFRCLKLAFDALKEGQSMLPFINAANEVLVNRFLKKEIEWIEIAERLENLMQKHNKMHIKTIDDVLHIDRLARKLAENV